MKKDPNKIILTAKDPKTNTVHQFDWDEWEGIDIPGVHGMTFKHRPEQKQNKG